MLCLRACEGLAELIVYVMVVFGPWAFGSTQPWSIGVLNTLGIVLGLLWVTSKLIRRRIQYLPFGRAQPPGSRHRPGLGARSCEVACVPKRLWARRVVVLLGGLTCALLSYCLVSAVNRRAVYLPAEERFDYRACVDWLPHSFDSTSTWNAFWSYFGLACSFWAIHDWVRGKTSAEQQMGRLRRHHETDAVVPARLKRLLWLLSLNGAALGLEAIVQRQTNCPRLLFLVQPAIHSNAQSQFGPFAYRANAAAYFNLLWPVSLAFWWTIRT
ncbi:MAG TPA: hypothetical protein VHI52_01735, partial [Verrucomicrobiae bacterium]|nr:hypothetical protein [Verrucomicrobiae bacterium]